MFISLQENKVITQTFQDTFGHIESHDQISSHQQHRVSSGGSSSRADEMGKTRIISRSELRMPVSESDTGAEISCRAVSPKLPKEGLEDIIILDVLRE